ncbi:MAG: hypothetical protein HQK91_01875 [Nitrospirae bacterium]|nr:hypothetical protein [Nitrospirota bacterium]MBF0540183.1 hypothetical protein [Nitrospirota bacterium]
MCRKSLLLSILFIFGVTLLPSISQAMPMWSTKYKVDCSKCHKNDAELGRYGNEFRFAGFRVPNEIGKDTGDFKIEDYLAGKGAVAAKFSNHDDSTNRSTPYTRAGIEAGSVTIYPLTGAWGKNFGSNVKIQVDRLNGAEDNGQLTIVNLWAMGVFGDESQFFSVKLGTMESFAISTSGTVSGMTLGFPSIPLVSKGTGSAATYNASSTLLSFTSMTGTESGIELGYNLFHYGDGGSKTTNISAKITNGIWYSGLPTASTIAADYNFGSYAGFFNSTNGITNNRPSYGIALSQYINDNISLSLTWYNGLLNNIPLGYTTTTGVNRATTSNDTVNRVSLYGKVYLIPGVFDFIPSVLYGTDKYDNAYLINNTLKGNNSSSSITINAEFEYHTPTTVLAASYCYSVPTSVSTGATISQFGLGGDQRFNQWLFLNSALTYKTTRYLTGGAYNDAALLATLMFTL